MNWACRSSRGAGTGLSGGAMPLRHGVMVSLAQFKRIVDVDRRGMHGSCNAVCAICRSPRRPPRTACTTRPTRRQIACTIGGNVAENSGGVHCLKYGLTVHNVLRVRAVTMEGELVEFGSLARMRRASICCRDHRQRGHARSRHRSHREAHPQAAARPLHHGSFDDVEAAATRSPASSQRASFRRVSK